MNWLPSLPCAKSREVSILIPAYEAEHFIDRTLLFARGQTHQACRILVSVDKCGDATAHRAHLHSAEDRRVKVIEQRVRQGWAGNVNALLERVETPYFCLYMHDDIIVPQYVEFLLALLEANPHAASAHCDMAHFGGSDHTSAARAYAGPTASRLACFLLAPQRGSPLRSLVRTSKAGDLRLPTDAQGGFWANEPFLLKLMAAGAALALPNSLYLRWQLRPGGLTDGWRGMDPQQGFECLRRNIATEIRTIRAALQTRPERQTAIAALYLFHLPRLLGVEKQAGCPLFKQPQDLHPAFARLKCTDWGLPGLPAETRDWVASRLQVINNDPRSLIPVGLSA
ncbi:MAG: glycosyltransferase family 2 protein [Prochlorococcaceae cyanobacterium]